MFRTPTGGLGFSFKRFLVAANPVFANDDKDDVDLSPRQQDALFQHQCSLEDPKVFNDFSLLVAGVVDQKPHSRTLLARLKKCGVVSPHDGSIHTELITRHFPHQVPDISIHRQRKLIGMLFFWEEELVRWRLLGEEEAEIRRAMVEREGEEAVVGGQGDLEGLKVALGRVLVARSMPPGLRGVVQEVRRGRGEGEEQPPGYEDLTRTVSISGGPARRAE